MDFHSLSHDDGSIHSILDLTSPIFYRFVLIMHAFQHSAPIIIPSHLYLRGYRFIMQSGVRARGELVG